MFLEDLLYQRSAFAMAMNIEESRVHVRLILDSGDSVIVRNFKIIEPPAGTDLGMILGIGENADAAMVLREANLHHARFSVAPERSAPIGFESEAGAAGD